MGTFFQINEGKISIDSLNDIILKKDRKFAGPSAPPQGLYLSKVIYDQDIYLWVKIILAATYLILKF